MRMSNSMLAQKLDKQFNGFLLGLLANSYTLTVTTTKTNYIATLDEVGTQTSARPNDGPVVLLGATTMYPGLIQTVRKTYNSRALCSLHYLFIMSSDRTTDTIIEHFDCT